MEDDLPAFEYTVEPLPPGRLGRRWRWQLYRGEHLVAAGWHHGEHRALTALRIAASRAAHELLGLHALRPERASVDRPFRAGMTVRLVSGAVACRLVPRPGPAAAAAAA